MSAHLTYVLSCNCGAQFATPLTWLSDGSRIMPRTVVEVRTQAGAAGWQSRPIDPRQPNPSQNDICPSCLVNGM
jgi:hypothetical protein